MEKTGQYLKRKLGLSDLKYVMISRVLITTYKTYIIFYDSRRPKAPITTKRALGSEHIAKLYMYPFKSEPTYLPLMNLEDFNGMLHPSMFFVVDLSGQYGDKRNKLELQRESYPAFHGNLQEYLTLADLNTQDATSQAILTRRSQRNRAVGAENTTAKLVDLSIDTVEDHVTFVFRTMATVPIYPDDHTFGKVNPDSFKIERNPDKEYELYIRVLDFFEWLNAQKQDREIAEITADDIKRVLEVSNVQVFSTSPSFHWQSMNFVASQLDASIYPTDIAPQFWDSIHGDDVILDKHLYGLLRSIAFFRNQMAAMLTKRLKQRELL